MWLRLCRGILWNPEEQENQGGWILSCRSRGITPSGVWLNCYNVFIIPIIKTLKFHA